MEIDYNFSLYGFKRTNYGANGAAFHRWEQPKAEEERKPEIKADRYYSDYNTQSFRIDIPKPQEKVLTGTVMITRQSKNRYSLAMQSGEGVKIISPVTSLTAIRGYVNEFFKE
jgi:hypothetical protein